MVRHEGRMEIRRFVAPLGPHVSPQVGRRKLHLGRRDQVAG